MSRMFKSIDKTWNVFVGCRFECSYCNAKKAAETRLRHLDRYKDGFNPHLVESELKKTFKPGEFIFIAYMGDISFADYEVIQAILWRVRLYPETHFLLQTKNPAIFAKWKLDISPNVYLGTTIETNVDWRLSKAPAPIERFRDLKGYPHNHKFLSIEPVIDFNLDTLLEWVVRMRPEIIEVGADNYHNHLPEPPPDKLEDLLACLEDICPNVIEKDGLERLKIRR